MSEIQVPIRHHTVITTTPIAWISNWRGAPSSSPEMPASEAVALTEAVLSVMEGMLPEYGATGMVRQPTGGRISTAAPTNAFPASDGGWVLIAAD